MFKSTSIQIKSQAELGQLLSEHKISLRPNNHSPINLELNGLSEKDNQIWSSILNKYYYVCGCVEGAIFLFIAIILCTFYFAVILKFKLTLSNYVLGTIFTISMTILGKFSGILAGKIHLTASVKKLIKTIEKQKI